MFWPQEHIIGIKAMLTMCTTLISVIPYRPTAAQLNALYPDVFATTDAVLHVNSSSSNSPAMIVVSQNQRQAMFCCAGMQNFDNAQTLINAWVNTAGIANADCQPYVSAANILLSVAPIDPGEILTTLVCIGHSFGGAQAAWTAVKSPNRDSTTQTYLYTFGAPKYAKRRSLTYFDQMIHRRLFLPHDPVTALPPAMHEGGAVYAFYSNAQARALTAYNRAGPGLILTPATLPYRFLDNWPPTMPQLLTSVLTWLIGPDCFSFPDHTLAQYIATIRTLLDVPLPPDGGGDYTDTPPDRTRTVPELVPTARQLDDNRAVNNAIAASVITSDPGGAVRAIQNGIVRVPRARYHSKKLRGSRYLYYGEQYLTPLKSRRQAIKIVRYLNRTLLD